MKKILFFTILIVSLIIIKNLLVSIYTLWQKQDLVVQANRELEEEMRTNNQLKGKLSLVQSQGYLEEQARNKLFMVKPNEEGVLIPKYMLEATNSSEKKPELTQNWRKWWELFFKK